MASNDTPPPSNFQSVSGGCCSGQTLAYLILRVLLGMLLLLSGIEKFKSPAAPYHYQWTYWHDKTNEAGEVVDWGKWRNVAKPVFDFGGFNNPAVWGEKTVNAFSHMFKGYALVLPYAMIAIGLCILVGFLNRVSLFLGAAIWVSLAAGQMTLPDNPTVWMLSNFTVYYVAALALVKYNRFALTRF